MDRIYFSVIIVCQTIYQNLKLKHKIQSYQNSVNKKFKSMTSRGKIEVTTEMCSFHFICRKVIFAKYYLYTVYKQHLLRSRQRSALSTEQSLSWLKRSAAVKTLTKYTATEYR